MSDESPLRMGHGAPEGAPAPYEGQERFYDGDFQVSSSPSLKGLLINLGVESASREEQARAARKAEENCTFPPAVLEVLRQAGLLDRQP